MDNGIERAKSLVRDIRDYPKKGIVFKDITPVLQDPEAFSAVIDEMASRLSGMDFDSIVGI